MCVWGGTVQVRNVCLCGGWYLMFLLLLSFYFIILFISCCCCFSYFLILTYHLLLFFFCRGLITWFDRHFNFELVVLNATHHVKLNYITFVYDRKYLPSVLFFNSGGGLSKLTTVNIHMFFLLLLKKKKYTSNYKVE